MYIHASLLLLLLFFFLSVCLFSLSLLSLPVLTSFPLVGVSDNWELDLPRNCTLMTAATSVLTRPVATAELNIIVFLALPNLEGNVSLSLANVSILFFNPCKT